ncbi:uncharacterized protein LOC107261044 isoform X1 [Ricinus communis]|uniref:uncharacterized protein LOC107261044 isoform X1 n=1 Tax=Ricinus communis TaxID=3988 RepID=UPI00201A4C25|nr:uncharacterized protein LOC107261044 isoform X1 [Ricinus communis]
MVWCRFEKNNIVLVAQLPLDNCIIFEVFLAAPAMPRTQAAAVAIVVQKGQDGVSTQSTPPAPAGDTRRGGRPRAAAQPDQGEAQETQDTGRVPIEAFVAGIIGM